MQYSANISILWRDIPLRQRLERVRQAGIHAFEFLFVESFGLDALSAAAQEGPSVALFDLDIGDPTFKSSYGYLCDPKAEQLFFRSLEQGIRDATTLRCRRLNALAGRSNPGLSWGRQRDLVVKRLRRAAPEAAEAGVELLVEAISSQALPGYLVGHSWQALEIVQLVDQPNVRLQYDVYHMQLMEGNLVSTLHRLLPWVGHIQIADVPGRHEPGTGEVNFPNLLKALVEMGYAGYVGLEYQPLKADPFAWMASLPPNLRPSTT